MRRIMTMMTAFAMAAVLFAEPLRICPACGREDLKGVEKCAYCGAALPPLPAKEAAGAPADVAPDPETLVSEEILKEASEDVAEARARSPKDVATSYALYENALALLAADAGESFQEKAAARIEEEVGTCRKRLEEMAQGSFLAHQKILHGGRASAVVYFKSRGRIPFGRVWVPADWPSRLPPPRLAAIRHGLQPVCRECNGEGAVPCRRCKGNGRIPCDNPSCKQGWVYSKTPNGLGGTSKWASTSLTVRERCPRCQGTAFCPCPDCRATGRSICRKCGGNGEAPLCTSCRGTGLVACKECSRAIEKGIRDKPSPDCPECRGSGEALCRKCGGDGRIRR